MKEEEGEKEKVGMGTRALVVIFFGTKDVLVIAYHSKNVEGLSSPVDKPMVGTEVLR